MIDSLSALFDFEPFVFKKSRVKILGETREKGGRSGTSYGNVQTLKLILDCMSNIYLVREVVVIDGGVPAVATIICFIK